jgi:1-deoxy-D-xylulose-5-phosphate reductoisomerase
VSELQPAPAGQGPRRRVTVLGATGSIGASAADVLEAQAGRFEVVALIGGRNAAALATLARRLGAACAVLADESAGPALAAELAGSGIANAAGASAVAEAIARETDIVVAGIAGTAGLEPTCAALQPGRVVALANKECLVTAGRAFMSEAARRQTRILPLDSEHNALLQALGGSDIDDVEMMTITASGGPFRTWPAQAIGGATVAQAMRHPTWQMGRKITIDSASLMNKGLELIEAHHLFGLEASRLSVIVHPQSIVHGIVNFRDGAVAAGMAAPDMRVPMAHCLGLSQRLSMATRRFDLVSLGQLTFEAPDETRFPCLRIAREVLAAGGVAPAVMNGANEIAVEAFLRGEIAFGAIPALVAEVLAAIPQAPAPVTISAALSIDQDARETARGVLSRFRHAANYA